MQALGAMLPFFKTAVAESKLKRSLINLKAMIVSIIACITFAKTAHADISTYSISCKNQFAVVNAEFVQVNAVSLLENSRQTILKIDRKAQGFPPVEMSGSRMRTAQKYDDGSVIFIGIFRGALAAMSIKHIDKAGNSLWEMTALGCREHAE